MTYDAEDHNYRVFIFKYYTELVTLTIYYTLLQWLQRLVGGKHLVFFVTTG